MRLSRTSKLSNGRRSGLTLGSLILALVLTVACGPDNNNELDNGLNDNLEDTEVATLPAPQDTMMEDGAQAMTTLMTAEGTQVGTVTFTQRGDEVEVMAQVTNADLPAGMHGFHVHENGACDPPSFESAGGHFNPTDMPHGGPDDMDRHAGDFGNIELDDTGSGTLESTTSMLTVAGTGANAVVGHAVILHEGQDDLETQPTGAAGGRYACGVVTEGGMESMAMEDDMDAMNDEAIQ